jgi:SAM-dependent methyltransferase
VRAISTDANRVLGLDIAPVAIAMAQAARRVGREEYAVGDFFNMAPEMRGTFDWIVEHTCFCAIEPGMRPGYAVAAADALRPGGRCFGIFYLEPASERQPPYGVTVGELDGLFAPFFTVEREWRPGRTFEGREGRELIRVLRRNGRG